MELVSDRIPFARVAKIYLFPLFMPAYYPAQSTKNFFENEPVLPYDSPFDLLHANSVRMVEQDIPGVCSRGDFLVSIRELNLVAVINADATKILWEAPPGLLELQHNATVIENGHILIFDNGTSRGFSRLVEIDPATDEVVWKYGAGPASEFYSGRRGGAQRLSNGNTLITESDRGRVFEVTKDGAIVWDFLNPEHTPGGKRRLIYRMDRLLPEELPRSLRRSLPAVKTPA
jgi:hypothetical protein